MFKIFQEIGAVEPLKAVASQSASATASKLAAQALHIIGEEVPHKLSQRVPLWSVEDVVFWVSSVSTFTLMILRFRTDMPGQTVQTQIRLLEKQSDQGLHCLQFPFHLLNALL